MFGSQRDRFSQRPRCLKLLPGDACHGEASLKDLQYVSELGQEFRRWGCPGFLRFLNDLGRQLTSEADVVEHLQGDMAAVSLTHRLVWVSGPQRLSQKAPEIGKNLGRGAEACGF